jgi:hypothetical protein
MKLILYSIIPFLLAGATCKTGQTNEIIDFSVTIYNYYFGRPDNITILTPDSITQEWNKTRGESKFYKHKLDEKEKRKVTKFIREFPLSDLKEQYVNEAVEDGINLSFEIRINTIKKTIFVSNMYNDDLGKLVELINTLVPEDNLGYHEKVFRE